MVKDIKQIRRNVLRAQGIDLPDEWLDTVHDVRADGDEIAYKFRALINIEHWKFSFGSVINA